MRREGAELSYDKDGNLLSDGTDEYTWNARGQLTAISGEHSASFAYDPFGRRISKTLGGTTTELLYDGANVALESQEGTTTASLLSGLQPDQLFARTTASGTASYLTDRLGSTVALANTSAEVTTSYAYEPFGTPTAAGTTSDNPYQFTGRENDGAGLQYNRARYYTFGAGRFISQDPSGFVGSGPNLYWYVAGDPLAFPDPSGECFGVCLPDLSETVENVANQVGDWVSAAAGVASSVLGFIARETDVSTEELIGALVNAAGGTMMCAAAASAASVVGTPAAGAAAYGFCTATEVIGAYETTTDILDHENELATKELFR